MSSLHRILDVNANRAREALRVMEDTARFDLEHAELIEFLKDLRHQLRRALDQPAFDRVRLIASRDSVHDEGRVIKHPGELTRRGVRDIAAAAGSRLTESLRSIEEAAKALGADSRPIESLRYQAYEAEKLLLLSLPTGRARQWRLCVLITESLCTGGLGWFDVAQAAAKGGADCIQLREKHLDSRELLDRAERLVQAMPAGCDVVINDRPDIALLSGATGVHLGQTDLAIHRAREVVGESLLIGVSTSSHTEARSAAQSGADYCGLGPMFPTTTKDKPRLAGPEYLRTFLNDALTCDRPHLAIGGITPDNVQLLVDAGCRGVAVSSIVCASAHPEAVCRRLLAAIPELSPGVA